jgi:16S rRNA (adenine1518-N6/adenine1519-N6)-dimethyltransferase
VFRLVRAAFGQRRKTLANALGVLGIPRAQLDEAIAATGIEPLARGETLALEQYVALADRLAERT